MERVYASLIIKGKRSFDSIPSKLKDKVKAILVEDGYEYLVVEEV